MLLAAAVVPHPPLLVPELAGAAAPELGPLRSDCDTAVAWLLDAEPDLVVVVASGPRRTQGGGAVGTLAPYGLARWCCGGQDADADGRLGLGHTIGAWLLDRAGWSGARRYESVDGAALDLPSDRVALLVAADGSARRTTQAPGYLDERAAGFDARLARALAAGATHVLDATDDALAAELWARGVPALRTLARTVERARTQQGAAIAARLDHDAAPYGVGYLCARWQLT